MIQVIPTRTWFGSALLRMPLWRFAGAIERYACAWQVARAFAPLDAPALRRDAQRTELHRPSTLHSTRNIHAI